MVPHSHKSFHHCYQILLALVLFSLQILTHIEAYGSKVKVLPGFQGPLPFELETGSAILTIPFSISFFFFLSKFSSFFYRNENCLIQFHLNNCRI
jgi:hypothetical protein